VPYSRRLLSNQDKANISGKLKHPNRSGIKSKRDGIARQLSEFFPSSNHTGLHVAITDENRRLNRGKARVRPTSHIRLLVR